MRAAVALTFIVLLTGSATHAEPVNLFEWLGMGDFVVAAENIGSNGKLQEFVVTTSLRGDLPEGTTLSVNLKRANRDRNRALDPKSRKLDLERTYLLLLDREHPPKKDAVERYGLVRGLRGIRELPSEGTRAYLDAAGRFIEIHDQKDDRVTWRRLEAMLEDTSPLLIETALEQFLKFRRGDSEIQGVLEPLLEHPSPGIRQRTAELLGQILQQHGSPGPAEAARVRQELTSRARRDASIDVRVAATRALDACEGPGVDEVLQTIAADDPDQVVRYTAERLLYERGRRGEAEETGDSRSGADGSAGGSGSAN